MSQRYKYLTDDGETVELTFDQMLAQDTGGYISLPDGRAARRLRELEPPIGSRARKRHACQAKYPIVSEAMAVNPEDVPKAQAVLQRAGVFTHYDGEGRPVLTSPGHRKKHAEAMGFYDRNGGYGDPQAKNR